MSLTVYMNTAKADLRDALLTDIKQEQQSKQNLTVYYIVPNHVKFDSEVDVLRRFAIKSGINPDNQFYAQSRLQVYSLTRLTWALLKDWSGTQPDILQNTGLFIMISNILDEYADKLPMFARMQSKNGFVSTLVNQILELRSSHISPQDLLSILNHETTDQTFLKQTLSGKLRDLAIVADALNQKIDNQYITTQEILPFFATQLSQHKLENVAFYFDGFNGFTSAEMQVMSELIKHYTVKIALFGNLERLGKQQPGDLFFKPMTTAQQLAALVKNSNQPVNFKQSHTTRQLSESIRKLLTTWEYVGEYREYIPDTVDQPFQLFSAENTTVEIEEVARKIRQLLVADSNLKLRDILILSRDLTPYVAYIPEIFKTFGLPYFLDIDQKMTNHPLVELIFNLLRPSNERFQYQQIMSILKTSLLRPFVNDSLVSEDEFFDIVSYLDNYVYANQPYEKKWRQLDEPFILFDIKETVDNDDVNILNGDATVNNRLAFIRQFIVEAFDKLDSLFSQSKTMRQASTNLLVWLQEFHVTDALLQQRDLLIEVGDLSNAKKGEEVWNMLTKTLDDIVNINGEEPFTLETFKIILNAGFEGATFSGIPNNLDSISISEAGIVQSNRYRYLFFIGGTRNNLPAQLKSRALINDSERLLVQPELQKISSPKYLQNTAQQQMAEENLLFYGALASVTDNVILSYPILDKTGQIAEMSPYFKRLVTVFGVKANKVMAVPETSDTLLKQYVGSVKATLSALSKLAVSERNTPAFIALKNIISQQNQQRLDLVLSAPKYKNQTVTLKPEFVKALFGDQLNISISQLESYYNNPLQYFLQYGLQLKPREENTFNIAQTGTFYHSVFELVLEQIIQQNRSLRDVTDVDLQKMVIDSAHLVLENPIYQLLKQSGKKRAIADYITQISVLLVKNMQRAARVNQGRPIAVEQLFGFPDSTSLPALKMMTSNGKINLRGKIDRVDVQDKASEFGTIIDYKSNGKKFDWAQAFDGRQMQLLTYWQAAQLATEKLGLAAIGGAFYAKISPEKSTIKEFKGDVESLLSGEIRAETFKYRGLFISESEYVDSLQSIEPGETSPFYQLRRKKTDGQLYADSDVIDPDEFELLLMRNQFNIKRAGDLILTGQFPLLPTLGSLQYTPYLDILRFDRALGDQYQIATPRKKSDILKLLKQAEEAE